MTNQPVNRAELSDWIARYIADLLQIDARQVELQKGLDHYGLDSADAVIMGAAMEERFDLELDPGVFIECQTFQDVVDALGGDEGTGDRSDEI